MGVDIRTLQEDCLQQKSRTVAMRHKALLGNYFSCAGGIFVSARTVLKVEAVRRAVGASTKAIISPGPHLEVVRLCMGDVSMIANSDGD